VLYLTIVVPFAVIMSKEEMLDAGEVLGARFLRKVYGDAIADKLFLVFIGMSVFGVSIAMVWISQYMNLELELTGCPLDFVAWKDVKRDRTGIQGMLLFTTFWS
jgi:hypothetical protein